MRAPRRSAAEAEALAASIQAQAVAACEAGPEALASFLSTPPAGVVLAATT